MEKKYIFIEHYQNENNLPAIRKIYEMPEEEFIKILPANETVFKVYRFEELLATLIDNFLEFNNVILSYADKARVQSLFKENYFQKRIDINRTALNFFASLNMYRDFVKTHINDTYITNFLDTSSAFQCCLIMRNYIQHVDFFPIISNVSYTSCDIDVMLASVRFQIDAADLKVDKLHKATNEKFYKYFLPGEKIDLYQIVNQGMDEILLIQSKIRNLPLYTVDYAESKVLLLDIEQKISRKNSSIVGLPHYFESDGNPNDLKTCFVATDTIKFIDENIKRFPCNRSSSNQYVTTAPKEFVDKCNSEIFVPAFNRRISKTN